MTVLVIWHCPVAGMQVSVVHALLSLQLTVPVVSHSPVVGLQTSVVHRLPSLQLSRVQNCACAPGAIADATRSQTRSAAAIDDLRGMFVPLSGGTVLPQCRIGKPLFVSPWTRTALPNRPSDTRDVGTDRRRGR